MQRQPSFLITMERNVNVTECREASRYLFLWIWTDLKPPSSGLLADLRKHHRSFWKERKKRVDGRYTCIKAIGTDFFEVCELFCELPGIYVMTCNQRRAQFKALAGELNRIQPSPPFFIHVFNFHILFICVILSACLSSIAKERSHDQIIHFHCLENILRNTFFSHLLPKDLLSWLREEAGHSIKASCGTLALVMLLMVLWGILSNFKCQNNDSGLGLGSMTRCLMSSVSVESLWLL